MKKLFLFTWYIVPFYYYICRQQMDKQFLRVYQVYYKPEQIPTLEPSYQSWYNPNATVYFENSVIAKLIKMGAHYGSEYFGVVSHALRDKVEDCRRGPRINQSNFNAAVFESKLKAGNYDVVSYLQYSPHNPLTYFYDIHPMLLLYFIEVTNKIGYVIPAGVILKDVIYCNAFVAKSNVYNQYVKDMLIPAMAVMDGIPELMTDSGYPMELPADLKLRWGINFYPYHSFICERLFSYWIYINGLKVGYY